MATLLEYFNFDFRRYISLGATLPFNYNLSLNNSDHNQTFNTEVIESVRHETESSARFFTYYVPQTPITYKIIKIIISERLDKSKHEVEGVVTISGFSGDTQIGTHTNVYSNRIYFYTETLLNVDQLNKLDQYCKDKGLFVTIRSTDYIKKKLETEKPLAFISHDTRDKELIAKPIASGLNSRRCTVWYDEYTLKIGDSLKETIEKGIKDAKKCIVVITNNYLTNPGWGKKEFNSIFTREMIMKERIVLPIWFDVTIEEIYEFSPSLLDTYALHWPSKSNKSETHYDQEVEQLISKIHTELTREDNK